MINYRAARSLPPMGHGRHDDAWHGAATAERPFRRTCTPRPSPATSRLITSHVSQACWKRTEEERAPVRSAAAGSGSKTSSSRTGHVNTTLGGESEPRSSGGPGWCGNSRMTSGFSATPAKARDASRGHSAGKTRPRSVNAGTRSSTAEAPCPTSDPVPRRPLNHRSDQAAVRPARSVASGAHLHFESFIGPIDSIPGLDLVVAAPACSLRCPCPANLRRGAEGPTGPTQRSAPRD